MTPKLVVLSAPSGTGKSTVAGILLKRLQKFEVSISYTTRPPRAGEKEGVHYFFIKDFEFKKMRQTGEFLEFALVFNKYWYGTAKETVEKILNKGKNVLFDIDVQGAKRLKELYKDRCITIFLSPPSIEELEKRLRLRNTEGSAAIATRLHTARSELKEIPNFDYQIINRDLEQTFKEIETILKNKGCLFD